MTRNALLSLFLVTLFVCSCGGGAGREAALPADSLTFRYARLLHIYRQGPTHVVVINNPWKPAAELHRYVLLPADSAVPAKLPEGTLVRTPLQRMTVFTSVHGSLVNELGALDQIAGVCDFEYVQSPAIVERVNAGLIGNMGSALNPNVELILSNKADGLLVSPFEKSGYGTLERTGIPLIECADYMEPTALGRAEWVRLFGLLTGRERTADSLFAAVEQRYNDLCRLATQATERPTLLCDLMNGAAWYVPGGTSTIGRVYQDGGADYLFADRKEGGSVRLSFETVYTRGHEADVWLIKYGRADDYTYASLVKEKAQYANFKAFKQRHVYGCNTLSVPFYDEEPFHPDRLLADVIHIFHPELLPDHELHFFKPLE